MFFKILKTKFNYILYFQLSGIFQCLFH
jgi:hypothetical protein